MPLGRSIPTEGTHHGAVVGARAGTPGGRAWAPGGLEALVGELVAQPALALAMTVDGLRALGRATSAPDIAWADPDLLRWSLRDGRR